jgi:integrase
VTKRRANGEGSLIFSDREQLWIGQITLPDGSRKRKRSKSQRIVRDWLLGVRTALKDGSFVADETITLAAFLDRYFETVAVPTLKPKTLENYGYLIRKHIKPALGPLRLTRLTPVHLQQFYADKLASGLSRRTVEFIHSILHKALSHAFKWGLVSRNVADLVDAPRPGKTEMQVWTLAQVKIFLEAVRDHKYFPIYVLAIFCGLREGEVLGLHFEDLDLPHARLHVRHTVQYIAGQGLIISQPKTDTSRRPVSLPGVALAVMNQYLPTRTPQTGLIFTTSHGTPVPPREVLRHFKLTEAALGLPVIRFHDLRHTHASLLFAAGVHPKLVQERLGHSNIAMTLDLYTHIIPSLQDGVADTLNDLFS